MRAALLTCWLAGTLLAGCSRGTHEAGCRPSFNTVTLAVTDAQGTPADGVEITLTNRRTGVVLGPCPADYGDDSAWTLPTPHGCPAGKPSAQGPYDPDAPALYTLASDADRSLFSRKGDEVLVRGVRTVGDFAEQFELSLVLADDGCHVRHLRGAEEAQLGRPKLR